MSANSKQLFSFTNSSFHSEEEVDEIERFENYLNFFSCNIGDVNQNYAEPMDENAIFNTPIIKLRNENYFAPIPNILSYGLPQIFDKFLVKEEGKTKSKYILTKSRFTENKVYNSFSRLFPKKTIFKNLRFEYQGKSYEVDILIIYDNKVFIIEAKSGGFTDPAKRGAPERLRRDLKNLIEAAYEQGNRTKYFITSSSVAIFKDKRGKERLEIRFAPGLIDFFIINVTLENLMSFNVGLQKLRSFDLFQENEYPWSVSLSELECIVEFISNPSVFIHYLEKRLLAQDSDVFFSFDELSLLVWYLENGSFQTPLTEEGKELDLVQLDASWIASIDEYYLLGKTPPKWNIGADY
jgi:hypothetical protein